MDDAPHRLQGACTNSSGPCSSHPKTLLQFAHSNSPFKRVEGCENPTAMETKDSHGAATQNRELCTPYKQQPASRPCSPLLPDRNLETLSSGRHHLVQRARTPVLCRASPLASFGALPTSRKAAGATKGSLCLLQAIGAKIPSRRRAQPRTTSRRVQHPTAPLHDVNATPRSVRSPQNSTSRLIRPHNEKSSNLGASFCPVRFGVSPREVTLSAAGQKSRGRDDGLKSVRLVNCDSLGKHRSSQSRVQHIS